MFLKLQYDAHELHSTKTKGPPEKSEKGETKHREHMFCDTLQNVYSQKKHI